MRKPTTKKKKKMEMPLRCTWFRPAALADASIGRTHWGWSCLQYPFIGERKMTLIPRNAAPFKSYCSAMYKGGCDTLLKKWKCTAECECHNLRPVPVSSDWHQQIGYVLYLCCTYVVPKKTNDRDRRLGQRAVVVCTYPYYIPTYLHRDNEHRIFVCIQKVSIFQANDTEIFNSGC